MSRPVHLVDTTASLALALAELEGPLAVDTEYHAERRYRTSLMLVQICAAEGPVVLIDVRAIRDLSPLSAILDEQCIIGHALDQDLQALDTRISSRPRSFRDPQILAGLSGYGFPRRLDELLPDVLGVAPPATCTLSDWSTRPLSESQQRYAAADVSHLHSLLEALEQQAPPERIAWASECAEEAAQLRLGPIDDDNAWKQINASRFLRDARDREALRQLAAWRECQARETNQTRHHVVSDAFLVDLARRRPQSTEEMLSNRLAPKRAVREYGDIFLACLGRADQAADELLPDSLALGPYQRAVAAALRGWAASQEAKEGISARLALPESLLEDVIRTWSRDEAPNLGSGWREQEFGASIRELLANHAEAREFCRHESDNA